MLPSYQEQYLSVYLILVLTQHTENMGIYQQKKQNEKHERKENKETKDKN